MDQNTSFTVLELQESIDRVPDLASTAEATVEVAVDDGIFRHSEHYPHYEHHKDPVAPPRPVMTYRKSSSGQQWELSGRVELLPHELTEVQQGGLEAFFKSRLGQRCAGVEAGELAGAVVPVRVLVHGARPALTPMATGTYPMSPDATRQTA